MTDFAFTTVLVSAGISIVTGFLGALLSQGWVRRQERRTYGLALLAEIKSIQRSLLRYEARLDRAGDAVAGREAAALRLWRHDLAVFANNTGRIGLFSSRTAIELIEFYHQVRWLEERGTELDASAARMNGLPAWLSGQREAIHRTRSRTRSLTRSLRRELPPTLADTLRVLGRGAWRARRPRGAAGDALAPAGVRADDLGGPGRLRGRGTAGDQRAAG
ncbi:hypothetical protein VQ02_02045 [Methylobacterium variabile]|jgi:hypothetical protein|uniref:Uncharacterized protein n=1 Tax=Methylobacterium variabile TaxID=298794 RepID=A0A0J6VU00_9HYPH|nr:hypothetical protein [Methylobacterium variabile]KMO42731.1 hypothetical protein VQ02_02045 [Methylobacterium variabile]